MQPSIRVFATDLDGTLLGNPSATGSFNRLWADRPADERPLLVYNTGRSLADVRAKIASGELTQPDFIIAQVGTAIFDVAADTLMADYAEAHGADWDVDRVALLVGASNERLERQPVRFQGPLKASWYLDEASEEELVTLRQILQDAGIPARVVFSNNRDLDILPETAGKGDALQWLCDHLHIPTSSVLVSGDRGNDITMFDLTDITGILVENAQPELYQATVGLNVYHATAAHADGVIEGLMHFGLVDQLDESPADRPDTCVLRLHDTHDGADELADEDRTYLQEAYRQGVETLRRNITPMGFSAASLADNEVTGTDENYRSVWGRDGAITLIHALETGDADLRSCSRTTLETLLAHTTEDGQVPANVRIDSGMPDYSGVGGICAIDSAMWVVIASFQYVEQTGDDSLLEQYGARLQNIMKWLQSHDSNRDGLLEIPEASDWTDLFGRSYNVLYDEVLWYRANVCMGLLCEQMGDCVQASSYLSHSQRIRGRILHAFWPTTAAVDDRLPTFADQQFSLGDARYLIAEVSPFSYSWRCDVYGNILAYLFNVIDAPKAREAMSFMWGCGVNDPWPVANLYPVVQAGDPDWRPYYTVNLLNLPHHYHNGGIWPLIGGLWVRFINRLGRTRVAERELISLARCCQQGQLHEWEFNEWYHGRTGRPMGKRFQAWSAATFVGACLDLGIVEPDS